MEMEKEKECTNWNIRKLTDGTFVLSTSDGEYSYDGSESLLNDLKEDLGSESREDDDSEDVEDKKKNVKKIMEEDDEDESY